MGHIEKTLCIVDSCHIAGFLPCAQKSVESYPIRHLVLQVDKANTGSEHIFCDFWGGGLKMPLKLLWLQY